MYPSFEDLSVLIDSLKTNIGEPFTNENNFKQHINTLINSDDYEIGKRASTLFALWSNIYFKLGDHPSATPEVIYQIQLLDKYRLSIFKELAAICSSIISKEVNQQLKIESLEEEQLFETLLKEVDTHIRKNRIPDRDAIPLLLNVLHKHQFNLEG